MLGYEAFMDLINKNKRWGDMIVKINRKPIDKKKAVRDRMVELASEWNSGRTVNIIDYVNMIDGIYLNQTEGEIKSIQLIREDDVMFEIESKKYDKRYCEINGCSFNKEEVKQFIEALQMVENELG